MSMGQGSSGSTTGGNLLDFGLAGGAGRRARDNRGPGAYSPGYTQGSNSYSTVGGGTQRIPWYSSGRGPANRQYEGAFGYGAMKGFGIGQMVKGTMDKRKARNDQKAKDADAKADQSANSAWHEDEERTYADSYYAEQDRLENPYNTYENAMDANSTPDVGMGMGDGSMGGGGFGDMMGGGGGGDMGMDAGGYF